MVAAIRRKSVRIGLVPPTRSISPSWMARSSFACRSKRRSPISSRNSVPPVASSNLPSCCLCAPVNAPALVAEQRALHELVGDRRHVHRDERRVAAARLPVQQPREQLLAGPALAEDQHRCRELRHPLDQIDDLADLLAGPDQELALALLGDLRAERDHLPVQILPLAGVADQRSELVVVEVLGDVVIGAVLHRLHSGLDLVDRRDHDALDEAVVLLDDPEHVEAADARQPHVQQDAGRRPRLSTGQRRLTARHAHHLVVPLQDGGQRIPHALIVVADQDGLGGPRSSGVAAF